MGDQWVKQLDLDVAREEIAMRRKAIEDGVNHLVTDGFLPSRGTQQRPETVEDVKAFIDALRRWRSGDHIRPDHVAHYRRDGEINALDAVMRYIETGEIPRAMLPPGRRFD